MGQYYVPTIINAKGEIKTFYSHDYGNGLKLMEHSWIGNNFVAAVMHELINTPHRIWWLGDYAETNDFKNKEHRLLAKDRKKAWSDKYNVSPSEENQKWDFNNIYVVNIDKKCYIRLSKPNDEWQVCPLPLLTAVGNGKGGGDYCGDIGKEDVGTWAGDLIMISYNKPNNMTDSTSDYYFEDQ